MAANDLVGIAILATLGPAMIGLVVWLTLLRPRQQAKAQRSRAESVARTLGLPVLDVGQVGGWRNGARVEVAFGLPNRYSPPATHCRAWLELPFGVPFAVTSPRFGAGCTERWSKDVGIGGPTPEALEVAKRLAPIVEDASRRNAGSVRRLELDRDSAVVVLDGYVLDAARLDAALALAVEIAQSARGAVPN